MDFPLMPDALKNHKVDGGWAVEPFVTLMEEAAGGRLILDSAKGSTVDFPIGAYTTTVAFAQRNPNTVAAFKRAISRASKLVGEDRSLVEKTLPTYSKIDAKTASLIHLSTYSSSVNQQRAQQVADLMTQYGFLKKHFDIKPML
jgi:NitT/TauT family transport system substrate-binding protein